MIVSISPILADQSDAAAGAMIVFLIVFYIVFFIIMLAVIGLMIAALWKIFEKAGEPGWQAIIPFYNGMIMARISGKPEWWFLLCFIPFAGIVFGIILAIELAKSFGQSGAFTAGMIFLPAIFYPILGFGRAQYIGRGGQPQQGFPVGPQG